MPARCVFLAVALVACLAGPALAAPWSVERVIEGLDSGDPEVQLKAMPHAKRYVSDERVVEALLRAFESDAARVRSWAGSHLRRVPATFHERVVGPLEGGLADPSGDVREICVIAMDTLGRVEAVRARLLELAGDEDSGVRGRVVGALAKLKDLSEAEVGAIVERMADPDPWVRQMTAHALRALGAKAAPGVPRMQEILNALHDSYVGHPRQTPDDPALRAALIEILTAIGPAAAPAAQDLALCIAYSMECGSSKQMNQGRYRATHPAWEALDRLGEAGATAVTWLLFGFGDRPTGLGMQLRGLEAYGAQGPAALRAVPAQWNLAERLAPWLTASSRSLRRLAAVAAVLLGPNGKDALRPAIERALAGERYPEVKRALQVALDAQVTDLADWRARLHDPLAEEEYDVGEFETPALQHAQALSFSLREGGAKLFAVDLSTPSSLHEGLIAEPEALTQRLDTLAWTGEAGLGLGWEAWFSHLDPELPVVRSQQASYVLRRAKERLFQAPLAELEALVGEPLFLGDLLQTDGYRGLETYMIMEVLDDAKQPTLRLINPTRLEYYVSPPASLSYPDVVPRVDFWGGDYYQVECVAVSHAWARTQLKGEQLAIEGQTYTLSDEVLAAINDPASDQQAYVFPQAREIWLQDR